MSMGGGGTQTVTNKSDPWPAAQPYLTDIMGQAQGLYNQGSEYAPFSTVVPFSPQTEAALTGIENRAISGSPVVGQANNTLLDLMGSGANNPALGYAQSIAAGVGGNNPAMGLAGNIASGGNNNQATGLAANLATRGVPNANEGYLTPTASGAYLHGNPYLDRNFSRAADQVRDYTNAAFSKAGRTGSAYYQDTLEKNIGDLAANMYGANYDAERNRQASAQTTLAGLGDSAASRQLSAAGLYGNLGAGDAAMRLSGTQLYGNLGQNDVSNRLSGAQLYGSLSNADSARRLAAAGAAPGLAANDYMDLGALQSVGQTREGLAGQQVQDLLSRWNYGQNQPWDLLSRYASTVNGFAGLGGTSTGTQPKPDNTGQIIGGIGTIATAAAMF